MIISSFSNPFQQNLKMTCENDARKFCSQYVTDMVRFISIFAREIPHFTQMDIDDQKTLIKHCVLESIIIHSVSLSPSTCEAMEEFGGINSNDSVQEGPLSRLIHDVISCVKKLRALKLTEVELAIFAAMVLFCAGNCICIWLIDYFSLFFNDCSLIQTSHCVGFDIDTLV